MCAIAAQAAEKKQKKRLLFQAGAERRTACAPRGLPIATCDLVGTQTWKDGLFFGARHGHQAAVRGSGALLRQQRYDTEFHRDNWKAMAPATEVRLRSFRGRDERR